VAKPNQVPKLTTFEGMDPVFSQHYSQLIDTVNTLAGYNGDIELSNHVNLGGRRIKNVGEPVDPTDAVSHDFANSKYSASKLRPQLESSGSQPMQSMRRLSDANQREQQSSYLNDLMSSVPNANEILPIFTTMGGGVQVVIPATKFQFADGFIVQLLSRTDLLSFPATFTISSISSVGDLVTVVTTTATGLTAGQVATISGVTPSGFNGVQTITGATPPFTLTYQDSLGTVSGSGGTLQLNGVYYYSVNKRNNRVHLFGPFAADTPQNRIGANFDGSQIVAVVVITASGGQVQQSGGGGTPTTGSPVGGTFF
jgi:hypothetical protein